MNDRQTVEYRARNVIPWADADHRLHPDTPHYCGCRCSATVEMDCGEHGWQVPREQRTVTTTYGEWEACPAVYLPTSAASLESS